MITEQAVLSALATVKDPDVQRDIVSLGFVKCLGIDGGQVALSIELATPVFAVRERVERDARRAVLALPDVTEVSTAMSWQVPGTHSDQKDKLVPGVKNVIPIGSGKGGVGKSTVSANLAVALVRLGARVGLMDADVYGPSIPILLGAAVPPERGTGQIVPPVRHGVKIMSMGFFIPKGEGLAWRGPMLSRMVEQFLGDVEWGELDYLLVDLPPGTGDVPLSLCQKIPLTGTAIVSTPQDLAFQVAEKAIFMFQKLRTPVLGLIENMSGFECSHCGQREEIFGSGGARRYAVTNGLPFLGDIPLSTDIRAASDAGRPIVESNPGSPGARAYFRIAENLAGQVSALYHRAAAMNSLEPAEISQRSPGEIRITWTDGHESIYTNFALRLACPCTSCVDGQSGKRTLREDSVARNVSPLAIQPTGQYALRFNWSDGHLTGLYTYDYLRALCACPTCMGTGKLDAEGRITRA
jgi:ATP-binding protein involved in chromosome partitioning